MHFFETIGGRISFFLILLVIISGLSYFYFMNNQKENSLVVEEGSSDAIFYTNLGNFEIEFFEEDAPKTVENFKTLASNNFYNEVKFHRIIKGFMIQGGDPLTKMAEMESAWGTGGPGYMFEDEIHQNNRNEVFTLAMANAGPNTNGSQFFINTNNNNFLDDKHTVFGKVVSGEDIIRKIEDSETKAKDIPVNPVIIEKIELK